MNLAFSAVVILFLAMPGICLFYAYRRGRGRPGPSSIADDVPLGITVSAFLHAAWVPLFNWLGCKWDVNAPVHVNLDAVLILLAAQGGKDGQMFKQASDAVTCGFYPYFALLYLISICVCAAILGLILRYIIGRWRLDRYVSSLRWNDWYYLLHGESPSGTPKKAPTDLIRVTALSGEYVYWGVLAGYTLSRDGQLDALVLDIPKRRKIGEGEDQDGGEDQNAHAIEADYLVLKYSECKNIGILAAALSDAGPLPAVDHPQQADGHPPQIGPTS